MSNRATQQRGSDPAVTQHETPDPQSALEGVCLPKFDRDKCVAAIGAAQTQIHSAATETEKTRLYEEFLVTQAGAKLNVDGVVTNQEKVAMERAEREIANKLKPQSQSAEAIGVIQREGVPAKSPPAQKIVRSGKVSNAGRISKSDAQALIAEVDLSRYQVEKVDGYRDGKKFTVTVVNLGKTKDGEDIPFEKGGKEIVTVNGRDASYRDIRLEEKTARAFVALRGWVKEQSQNPEYPAAMGLVVESSFRTMDQQKALHGNYVAWNAAKDKIEKREDLSDPEKAAEIKKLGTVFPADQPGKSGHQLGTQIDIRTTMKVTDDRGREQRIEAPYYRVIAENKAAFGFEQLNNPEHRHHFEYRDNTPPTAYAAAKRK